MLAVGAFPVKFGFRFGHSLCCIKNKLFVLGGFGEVANETSGKHLRLNHIEIVDLEKLTVSIVNPTSKLVGDRIFHCSTAWASSKDGEESILVSFGRSNPSKLYSSLVELKLVDDNSQLLEDKNVSIEDLKITANPGTRLEDLARFRHSACTDSDKTRLFIFGGKYLDEERKMSVNLNDLYVVDQSLTLNKKHVSTF